MFDKEGAWVWGVVALHPGHDVEFQNCCKVVGSGAIEDCGLKKEELLVAECWVISPGALKEVIIGLLFLLTEGTHWGWVVSVAMEFGKSGEAAVGKFDCLMALSKGEVGQQTV